MSAPERVWSPRAPSGKWDAIVVGSGVGGLSAAALLGLFGRRVLVLEQHGIPGGFSQSFRRDKWSWDVGLHVVGEMGGASPVGRVMDALCEGRLAWNRVPGAYDVVETADGLKIELPAHMGELRESLTRAFPDERANIREYLRLVHEAAAAMRARWVARPLSGGYAFPRDSARSAAALELALTTSDEVVRRVTANPRLRMVLLTQWGFYGTPPAASAFGVHALLCRHFRAGGYYPEGGAQSISRALCATVARHGGWTRVGADVAEILLDRGRAVGVRLTDGEELRAPLVIAACGALNMLSLLPVEERNRPWSRAISALAPSCGHVCLNVGFEGDIRAAGAGPTNRWFLEEPMGSDHVWDPADPASPFPGAYVSFPSLKDGSRTDHHTAEMLALAPWSAFARWSDTRRTRRPDDYRAFKSAISGRFLDLLLRRMPGLAPHVRRTELSTPLSTAHFARGVKGAIYGLDATPERYRCTWLRPRTPVPGLLMAGSDVSVVGIAGALAGGLAAVASVLPERAAPWLRDVVRPPSSRGG